MAVSFDSRKPESTPLLSPHSSATDHLPLDVHASLSSSPAGNSMASTQIEHVTDPQDYTQEKTQNIFQRVWSNMSGLSKGLSICTLSLYFWGYMLGFALGLIPKTPKQEPVTVVGQAGTLSPTRELSRLQSVEGPWIPDFATEGPISVDSGYSDPTFTYRETREEKGRTQKTLVEEILKKDETIRFCVAEFGFMAVPAGYKAEDFIEVIQFDKPLEDMKLKYYGTAKGTGAAIISVFTGKDLTKGMISVDHKKKIEEYYSEASQAQKSKIALTGDLRILREEILQSYSASDAFTSMVERGIPYQLKVNDTLISRFGFPAAKMLDINTQLASWSDRGEIQLSEEDPAIVAQQYLVRLAEPTPFTVDECELGREYTLETSGKHSVAVVRGNPKEIQSQREVQLKDKGGQVIKTYQWNETIRIFPEQRNRVEITRDVREIK